jgi:hypothetical protein
MGNFALIDPHTAQEHYSKKPYTASGSNWTLVFSDEFEVEGRSFYPGDDPYWEAVDLHYWQVMYIATLPASRLLTSLVDEQHGMVRPFGHHDQERFPQDYLVGRHREPGAWHELHWRSHVDMEQVLLHWWHR